LGSEPSGTRIGKGESDEVIEELVRRDEVEVVQIWVVHLENCEREREKWETREFRLDIEEEGR